MNHTATARGANPLSAPFFLGSIIGLTDALGGKSAMSYDELGNVIAVLQKNSGTVNAAYDPLGHLLKENDALGNTTAYEYDANGKVTKITDALGQSAEIAYDATGNVTRVGAPDGSETSYAYDLAGRLLCDKGTEFLPCPTLLTSLKARGADHSPHCVNAFSAFCSFYSAPVRFFSRKTL